MCCYVNDWNLFDKFYYKLKTIIEKCFTYIIYLIVVIKKHINIDINNTIYYKLISKISYDIFSLLAMINYHGDLNPKTHHLFLTHHLPQLFYHQTHKTLHP